VEYEGPDGPGQGTLVNLSRDGWRIRSNRPMSCGTVLALRVYLPEQPVPLDVEKAIVRWTDGTEFGAELISLQPDAASQLSHYLASHSPQSDSGHLATVSPFSYN
ncbi:MAG TPA: PilZ domain-containing protein, partial [Nitrospiraceae bacterium]